MKSHAETTSRAFVLFFVLTTQFSIAHAFEGRIHAVITQGSRTTPLLYTVGTNFLRVAVTAANRPHPVDIFNRTSGDLTLLFPHNRSFVRLKAAALNPSSRVRSVPAMPMPAGMGPRSSSAPAPAGHISPTNLPGKPTLPAMPRMPNRPQIPMNSGTPALPMMPAPRETIELKAADETTNLLGYTCNCYELKQHDETMKIWATDRLFPFQRYVQNQPHRFGPRMLEEEWGDLLKARKLFPLLATLKFDNDAGRYRFEVTSIAPELLTAADARLFRPPTNYFEIQPLPF